MCAEFNTHANGGVIGSQQIVGTWQECGVLCLAEPSCNYWKWNHAGVTVSILPACQPAGTCCLISTITTSFTSAGFVSGLRGCFEVTTTTTETTILSMDSVRGAAAVAGAVGAIAAISVPVPPMAIPGSAPLGVPAPGTPGGGIPPVGNAPVVQAGLALVPAGLTAVAIFPPTGIQQFPALSVIFSEAPNVIRYIF